MMIRLPLFVVFVTNDMSQFSLFKHKAHPIHKMIFWFSIFLPAMTIQVDIRLGIDESDESLEMGKQGPCTRAQKIRWLYRYFSCHCEISSAPSCSMLKTLWVLTKETSYQCKQSIVNATASDFSGWLKEKKIRVYAWRWNMQQQHGPLLNQPIDIKFSKSHS